MSVKVVYEDVAVGSAAIRGMDKHESNVASATIKAVMRYAIQCLKLENFITKEMYAREVLLRG